MQAIILAGGFGTRLKPIVNDVPKPMAPVRGRPFLYWLLEYMENQGITESVLCLHHLPEQIMGYFGDRFGAMKLQYSIETAPLGTGGALKTALKLLNPAQSVFGLNGDSLVCVDYTRMFASHNAAKRPITLATRNVEDCSRYSELTIQHDRIARFDVLGRPHPGIISAGFYVLSPDVFAGYELPEAFSFERDFLNPNMTRLNANAYHGVEYFIDIGVPDDYALAQHEIPLLAA